MAVLPTTNTSYDTAALLTIVGTYVWDVNTLNWVKAAQVDVGAGGPGLTDAELRLTPVPISGTVTATGPLTDTQLRNTPVPVSGTVSVNTHAVTQSGTWNIGTLTSITNPIAVTGTFFQATQPVSIASMPSTPVTGTFWQSTQPVSIASMPSTPVTGTFWQATQPVSGTFWQSSQPVTDPAIGDISARPSAYTVLDRLYQLGLKLDTLTKSSASEATTQKVLAVLSKPVPKPYSTLLHRS